MSLPETEPCAEDVLLAYGITGSLVDPFAIAQSEGIRLLGGRYDGCFDGRLEYRRRGEEGTFYLFYAEPEQGRRSTKRVRFSIAHELGHYFLPRHREYLLSGVWHGSKSEFASDKETEREADLFAASLLMPRRVFLERVRTFPSGTCMLKDLVKLAESDFAVSLLSAAIRYVQLDVEPCCVVLSDDGRVRFGMPSESLAVSGAGWVQKGSRVPAPTLTGKLIRNEASDSELREGRAVDGDVWFSSSGSLSLWEEARPLGHEGVVLTLLTAEAREDDC